MHRASALLVSSAVLLTMACGGSSSSSTATTSPASTPSAATVSMSTQLASTFTKELAGMIPGTATPSGLMASDTANPVQPLKHLVPVQASRAFDAAATTPCSPVVTTSTDPSGYHVMVQDYTACTDGSGGKVTFRWKGGAAQYDWQIAYDHYKLAFTLDGKVTTMSMDGSLAFTGTAGANGDWTFSYTTGGTSLHSAITSGGQVLFDWNYATNLTCLWHVTAQSPLKATFTIYGQSSWGGTFTDPQANKTYSDTFAFSIAQATPLVWSVDKSSPTPCLYPISGTIDVAKGAEKLSITFTDTCGSVLVNPGGQKQQLP